MAGSESRPRILLVDDDPLVLRLLQLLLGEEGYETRTAPGAAEARPLLKDGAWSLLITDLHMPGGTGLDLVRELRDRKDPLPVLLLSGSIEEGTRREADQLGGVECMSKPVERPKLLAAVRRLKA